MDGGGKLYCAEAKGFFFLCASWELWGPGRSPDLTGGKGEKPTFPFFHSPRFVFDQKGEKRMKGVHSTLEASLFPPVIG